MKPYCRKPKDLQLPSQHRAEIETLKSRLETCSAGGCFIDGVTIALQPISL
jgi:hypothetical protein